MTASGSDDVLISSNPAHVRAWLSKNHPKQLEELDNFEIELRLGRLSTSSTAAARSASDGRLDADITQDYTPTPGTAKGVGRGRNKDRRLVTTRTVELLRSIIGNTKWKTPADLMNILRGLGKDLHAAGGFREPAIGNVVRRVMGAVREEATSYETQKQSSQVAQQASSRNPSLSSMLWALPQHTTVKRSPHVNNRKLRGDSISSVASENFATSDGHPSEAFPHFFHANKPELKTNVMEVIQEVKDELTDLHKNINEQAPHHIHADEVIMTYARSKTVELFLKAAAAKKRNFQVIICEGAPHFGGHVMAKSLASAGIDTTVINDSAAFAIMARVNKVLLPAHAVLANGGLIAPSGSHLISLAAKQNSVPVVTITGIFKLCPVFPHEGQDTLNDLISPSSVVNIEDSEYENVEFVNPVHDYIPPQLVELYITNVGCFQPSYIYRLLAEYYHMDDWESF
uniref:Translation initiation factor eIF2B subunit beta n=2 Tax=Leptocylindrus danicus TaxID=163516 RepID=A0A7S2LE62_9STRA|mmetsp:Transcript_4518/g.6595  ORF Transcript_4518/g.6595 Transcript_4518/m.6595 type:complete len:457 (+) Transcript_4518:49-1419(+)